MLILSHLMVSNRYCDDAHFADVVTKAQRDTQRDTLVKVSEPGRTKQSEYQTFFFLPAKPSGSIPMKSYLSFQA